MYSMGEYVLYGIHGVCRVAGFEKQLVNRKRTEYMILEPVNSSESRFYLPTANPAALEKLKPVLSAAQLQELLASGEIRKPCAIGDENRRKQYYRELLGSGDRHSILRTLCSLYRYREEQLAAGRKFHLCDDNFLRDAEKLLASEIGLVLEMTPEAARDYLRQQLK